MKEKILDAFKALGFEMEDMVVGYDFQYEGKHYLYMYNEDDEDFLNIALPAVHSMDDEDTLGFYQLIDKINATLKYVKANTINDSIWLFYERELLGGEDLKQVISCMILHLESGFRYLGMTTAGMEDNVDSTPDASDCDTDTNNGEDAA